MSKELTVVLNGEQKTLEIREGAALPLHELKTLSIAGTLSAPGDFKAIREQQFPIDKTHVIVDHEAGSITINTADREDVGKISITGLLQVHPDFTKIGINDPEVERSPAELATWIKMNRTFFDSKVVAMNLVTLLRNFKATVNKKLEESTTERANYSTLKEQIVNSNIPEGFNITVPLYVGEKAVKFIVEVVIDPESYACALISPDAADMMRKRKDELFEKQIERFSGYAIIYK